MLSFLNERLKEKALLTQETVREVQCKKNKLKSRKQIRKQMQERRVEST